MSRQSTQEALFEIATAQKGYFTAWQAKQAGISDNNHAYHVRRGNWIREWRGIYRLRDFPWQEDEQYALWGIWSMNRKGEILGTYSHETALSMYDLSDVNPAKLHMTVPRGFRRHSETPGILRLHYSSIQSEEYEEREGYKVTKPFRTIADLVRQGTISDEFIVQAVREGLQRGVLTQQQYSDIKNTPRVGPKLVALLGEKA